MALPQLQPTTPRAPIGAPIPSLRYSLERAAARYGAPYPVWNDNRKVRMAIFGNEFEEYEAFIAGGTCYREGTGLTMKGYSIKEVHSIVEQYSRIHRQAGALVEINPIDALCWYAERTLANAPAIVLTEPEPEPPANTCTALMLYGYDDKHDPLRHAAQDALFAEHFKDVTAQLYAGVGG